MYQAALGWLPCFTYFGQVVQESVQWTLYPRTCLAFIHPCLPVRLFQAFLSHELEWFQSVCLSSLGAKTKGRIPPVSCMASRALNAFSWNPTFSTSQKWEFSHFPPCISCCKVWNEHSQTRGHPVKKSLEAYLGSFLNWKQQNVAIQTVPLSPYWFIFWRFNNRKTSGQE